MHKQKVIILLILFMIQSVHAQTNVQTQFDSKGLNGSHLSKDSNVMGLLSPSASFRGENRWERVGYYMNGVGDVNADGCEDFLIGTFHNRTNGYDAGACYLLLGNRSNIWGLNRPLAYSDARFLGKEAYDAFGYWISGRGDLNKDGYDDMIIGAPAGNKKGGLKPGKTYIIFGKQNPDWGYDFVPDDQADASYIGENPFDHCGQSLSIVGDMNGDGYDDFIVGSPYNDDGGTDAGKVYLILGRSAGWSRDMPVSGAAASFIGSDSLGLAGYSCSCAGDVNGDNIPDFIIGAPDDREAGIHAGKVYLIFGRPQINWGIDFNLANADVQFLAEKANDQAGWSLADAGDVNGDGYGDLVIGAWGSNDGGIKSGKAYLILGRSSWPAKMSLSNADASFYGEFSWENAGWSVSGVKDHNEDGYDEILIGAWHNKAAGYDAGKMYVIYGKSEGWQKNVWLGSIQEYFTGERDGDYAGYCVAGADMNGDGLGDFLTSATYNSERGEWAGEIYLFLSNRNYYKIGGSVRYYSNNLPVPSVDLTIQGDINSSVTTSDSGGYEISLYNGDYLFSPAKQTGADIDEFSILAYDAALTAQAAVQLIQLNPEQSVAANVDCDTAVTMFDAMLIAHHVAGLAKPAESHVAEWKFEPANHHYENLYGDFLNENYTGIILGNVNGFWQVPGTVQKRLEYYNIAQYVNVQDVGIGERISIPCLIDQSEKDVISADVDINFDQSALRYVGFEKGEPGAHLNVVDNAQDGRLRICIYGTEPVNQAGLLGNIIFEVLKTKNSSTFIDINRYQLNNFSPKKTSLNVTFAGQLAEIKTFTLEQNYPNPFSDSKGSVNSGTMIKYEIPEQSHVSVQVFNVLGQKVRTLVDKTREPGRYVLFWDGKNDSGGKLSNGIYIAVLKFKGYTKTIRMIKM